jgi:hypothetical protein
MEIIDQITHYQLLMELFSIAQIYKGTTLDSSQSFRFVSFRSPYLFYQLTVGVEVIYFNLITLRHTPQSVGLLWTRDRPVAETST